MTITLAQIGALKTPGEAKSLADHFMRGCEPRSPEYLEGVVDAFIREAKRAHGRAEDSLNRGDRYPMQTAQRDAYYAGVEAAKNHAAMLRTEEELGKIRRTA